MKSPNPIAQFGAQFVKPFLMADGSPRYLFEAGEEAVEYMTKLSKTKSSGQYLHVMVFDFDEWMEYLRTQTGQL